MDALAEVEELLLLLLLALWVELWELAWGRGTKWIVCWSHRPFTSRTRGMVLLLGLAVVVLLVEGDGVDGVEVLFVDDDGTPTPTLVASPNSASTSVG